MGFDPYSLVIRVPLTVGFLFPGQGAQYVGMGKDLAVSFETAKKIYEKADSILGYSISRLCFEGPEEELTRTVYAQPAIFVTSITALSVLREKYPDINPGFSAGLSLGEFTALVACGSISFEDGLRLVDRRARAMEKCAQNHPGTMASIMGLTEADCQEIAKEAGCEVANINTSDQIVLSGKLDTIQTACSLAEAGGAKRAIVLKVGGAFHSSLMKDAKNELESALASTSIASPRGIFISNALGDPVSDPEKIRKLLAMQLISPVRWTQTMQHADQAGMSLFLEIGPGKVLKGLARKGYTNVKVEACGSVDDIHKINLGVSHA
ncbi:MAG: ACP S-malonyltransferase [Candidatus Omnitrophica bacterium]|nr:ACP S-malonyltransferase [Candidatus Omnitrophota bacterium]